jgi:hypothetical protein
MENLLDEVVGVFATGQVDDPIMEMQVVLAHGGKFFQAWLL